jgi:hypothetical protein
MKFKIIILFIAFFYIFNTSKAQSLTDTLSFAKLSFYGNSIILNGKHIGLSKVRKMTSHIPDEEQHFKNINRIRMAAYPLSITGGLLTGFGLGGLLFVNDGNVTNQIFLLSSGVATLFSLYQLQYLEKQEMKAIVETYNRSLRK